MRYGINEEVWDKILNVLMNNPKIQSVILFGSRAKGNFKKGSDIDLALKTLNLTYSELLHLLTKLNDLDIPQEIDLVNYDTIKDEAVKEHIDRVGILLT